MTNEEHSNSFQVLGISLAYTIDPAVIERAYLMKLSQSHPDVSGAGGDADAARINDARRVLLDDELRANELLRVSGGPAASDCRDLPDGFLFEMMEIRQEIESDLEEDADEARIRWEQWAKDQRETYHSEIAAIFDHVLSEDHCVKIRIKLNAWRYIERLLEQLDPGYDPGREVL